MPTRFSFFMPMTFLIRHRKFSHQHSLSLDRALLCLGGLGDGKSFEGSTSKTQKDRIRPASRASRKRNLIFKKETGCWEYHLCALYFFSSSVDPQLLSGPSGLLSFPFHIQSFRKEVVCWGPGRGVGGGGYQ